MNMKMTKKGGKAGWNESRRYCIVFQRDFRAEKKWIWNGNDGQREKERERVSYYAKREDHLRHFQFLKIHEPSFLFFSKISAVLAIEYIFLRFFFGCHDYLFGFAPWDPNVASERRPLPHNFHGGCKGCWNPLSWPCGIGQHFLPNFIKENFNRISKLSMPIYEYGAATR